MGSPFKTRKKRHRLFVIFTCAEGRAWQEVDILQPLHIDLGIHFRFILWYCSIINHCSWFKDIIFGYYSIIILAVGFKNITSMQRYLTGAPRQQPPRARGKIVRTWRKTLSFVSKEIIIQINLFLSKWKSLVFTCTLCPPGRCAVGSARQGATWLKTKLWNQRTPTWSVWCRWSSNIMNGLDFIDVMWSNHIGRTDQGSDGCLVGGE